MFSLKLFGGLSLEGDGGPVSGRAVQRHRLALLALLSASRPRVSRDKLMAWLWPERDSERARGLLNQAVHVLRQALGREAVISTGEELQLNPGVVSCGVTAFEEAVVAGELERAVSLSTGPFLDGFFLSEAPEFERWAEGERERLTSLHACVLEMLAEQAGAKKDWPGAVQWWKRRVALDPYDSRAVARLMLALEASGNRAAAVVQAEAHQRLLQEELSLEPSPEVRTLAERLRSSPGGSASWLSVEPASSSPSVPSAPAVVGAELAAAPAGTIQLARRRSALWYGGATILVVSVVLMVVWLGSGRSAARSATNVPAATVDEIAKAVAAELDRRQRGDTAVRLRQHRTTNLAAYEMYLRGNDPTLLRSDSAALLGLDYLRRAVKLDSNYAAAWAALARLTLRTKLSGTQPFTQEVFATAERAARKAIALDDSLAEAHGTWALIQRGRFELAGAEASLRRAIALDPGTSLYHEWLVRLYVWLGRPAEALAEAREGVRLNPLSPSANAELARALLANRRPDEALAQLEKLSGLEPPLARAAGLVAQGYALKGMWPEAVAAVRPRAGENRSTLFGYLLGRAGQREEASRVLAALLERQRTRGGISLEVALTYLGLGDVDQAVPWLARALDDRSLSAVAEEFPLAGFLLDSLRGDPRIARLRGRMRPPDR